MVFAAVLPALAACNGAGAEPPSPAPTSPPESVTALPALQEAGSGGELPPTGTELLLRQHLANRLRVPAGGIALLRLETAVWPDGCLGLSTPGTVCTQALVNGWLAVLRAPDGTEYRYRGAGDRFIAE